MLVTSVSNSAKCGMNCFIVFHKSVIASCIPNALLFQISKATPIPIIAIPRGPSAVRNPLTPIPNPFKLRDAFPNAIRNFPMSKIMVLKVLLIAMADIRVDSIAPLVFKNSFCVLDNTVFNVITENATVCPTINPKFTNSEFNASCSATTSRCSISNFV